MNCDNCARCVKAGETWVPYGSTTVKYTDDYVCAEGWELGDCEGEDYEPRYPIRAGYQAAIDAGVD